MTGLGLVERAVGGAPVELLVAGQLVPAAALGPVTMRHGRSDVDDRPAAATLSAQLRTDQLPRLPELGDAVSVRLTDAAAAAFGVTGSRARFTGRVTDLVATPVAGQLGPAYLQLVAAGVRARLGALFIGSVPYPVELDGARAERILSAAQLLDTSLTVAPAADQTPGTVRVLGRDVDRQPALRLLDELAEDSGGELVEYRDGRLAWRDALSWSATVPAVTLSSSEALRPTSWRKSLRGLVNRLRLGYGQTPVDSSSQTEVEVADTYAAERFGWIDARAGSQLFDQTAAESAALLTVARRGRPRWTLDQLTVELVRGLSREQAGRLLELEQGALIGVRGFPTSGPFATARLWLLGWTEAVERDSWTLALDVAHYAAVARPVPWADVPTLGGARSELLTQVDRDYGPTTSTWGGSAPAGSTVTYPAEGTRWARRVALGSTAGALSHWRNGQLPLAGGDVAEVAVSWDVEAPAGVRVRLQLSAFDAAGAAVTILGSNIETVPTSGRLTIASTFAIPAGRVGIAPAVQLGGLNAGGPSVPAGSVVTYRTPSATRPGVVWQGVEASLSWLAAAAWELPDVDLGRWLDPPADARWSQLDPAQSWQTYRTPIR